MNANTLKQQINYLESVLDSNIRLRCQPEIALPIVTKFRGRKKRLSSDVWIIPYDSDIALANILGELRDQNVYMAGGSSGWPPSEVFKELRAKGHLKGKFKEILWYSPEEHLVIEQ